MSCPHSQCPIWDKQEHLSWLHIHCTGRFHAVKTKQPWSDQVLKTLSLKRARVKNVQLLRTHTIERHRRSKLYMSHLIVAI